VAQSRRLAQTPGKPFYQEREGIICLANENRSFLLDGATTKKLKIAISKEAVAATSAAITVALLNVGIQNDVLLPLLKLIRKPLRE
jgi:hypothetical protein